MKREEKREKGRNIQRENNEKEGNGIDGNYL